MWPVGARLRAGEAEDVWHAKTTVGVWKHQCAATSFVQIQGNMLIICLFMLIICGLKIKMTARWNISAITQHMI